MVSIPHPPPTHGIPLIRWIWRAYFRTSLIPLLLVEVGLIAIYFASNAISTQANIEAVREQAEHELAQLASREARGINQQLKGITQATEFLRRETQRVMVQGGSAMRDDPARYAYSKDGAYYTTRDNGGSALFYSGHQPVGAAERTKAMRSAGLDPAFKGIQQAFPLIVQVYYNTHDSLNRIYPYFDVIAQYAPHMDIPSFNFYYEADLAHNPQRSVVWTDVYVDPAGQGWMASCIAPVYRGDFLEGVIGSDITVNAMVSDVLNLSIPWAGYGMLLSREGAIIAMPQAGDADWGKESTTSHEYDAAIRQDTFRADSANLFKRTGYGELPQHIRAQATGLEHVRLSQDSLIAWATIPETGWKLVVVAPERNIYLPAQTLAARLNRIALLMVLGMVLFYVVFFLLLYRRARAMSRFLSEPLQRIDDMVADIGNGRYRPQLQALPVTELDRTARGIAHMAEQLDSAWQQRDRAETELSSQKQRLQSVFDLSPDAFIATDAEARIVLVNPAFLAWTGSMADTWLGMHKDKLWQRLLADGDARNVPGDGEVLRLELQQPEARQLLCATRAIHLAQGEGERYAGSVIYMRDITREEELVRMKSEFLALAAHELRTPLTSVLGYAELLLQGRVEGAMREEALQIIHGQAKWLVRIINDLVDLSRIEARGKGLLQPVTLDCAELVQATLGLHAPVAGRPAPRLALIPQMMVHVDPGKLQQALLNVIDNAYKYSAAGEVAIEMIEEAQGGRIGIRVSDHGIGMSPAELGRIFERFWRGDKSGSTPGTGLGMCLTHEIVTLHGGSIDITSAPGSGTQVTLWLPRIQNNNQEREA